MSDTPVCIKGIGFDSRTGGFAAISVDDVEYSAEYIGKCSQRVKELDSQLAKCQDFLFQQDMGTMPRSDLGTFLKMLDGCGHKYSVEENTEVDFYVGRGSHSVKHVGVVDIVTVEGTFYDDLRVYFDCHGNLLEMQSHVAFSNPATLALKKHLGVADE